MFDKVHVYMLYNSSLTNYYQGHNHVQNGPTDVPYKNIPVQK